MRIMTSSRGICAVSIFIRFLNSAHAQLQLQFAALGKVHVQRDHLRTRSGAWIDLDGDGNQDIASRNSLAKNKHCLNKGVGTFKDATALVVCRFDRKNLHQPTVAQSEADPYAALRKTRAAGHGCVPVQPLNYLNGVLP